MGEHWADERLIAHLYGVESADDHLAVCGECRQRLVAMEARRDLLVNDSVDVPADFLAAQRRAIYARMEEKRGVSMRRWAPALAALALMAGGVVMFEENRKAVERDQIDAELVQQVGQMAQDPTPRAVAPIEALFAE